MPIFTPRSQEAVLRDLVSKVVSRTELSDVSVGSTLFTLLNAISLEIANTESRLANIRRGFAIQNASGSDLDARVAELPPSGIRRKRNINASGSVLTIYRDSADILDDLFIPAGSTVQNGETGIQYKTAYDNIILAGSDKIENVYIVSNTSGEAGNCLDGTINTISTMPDGVTLVENTAPLTNGQNFEDDTSLRNRAMRYINSLGRVNKSALEFIGTSYVSTQGLSFKFARIFEDLEKPGYSELIVDDGTGLINPGIQTIESREHVIPSDGAQILTHERPAVNPLNTGNIVLTRGGEELPVTESDFTSIPERGIVYFKEGFLQEDDIVRIRGVRVYQGLMAELQNEIEGNSNNGSILTGFRAAGCRVRVVPPDITDFKVNIAILVEPGDNQEIIGKRVQNAAIDFVNNLDIGEELIPSRLITHLMRTQNIISCNLYIFNTTTPLETTYPSSARHVLRTKTDFITIESRG